MQQRRFVKVADAFAEETPEGLVVMGPSGQILKFNGVGAFLWHQCDGRRTVAELVEAVLGEYQAPSASQVVQDVEAFFNFLLEQQLVEQGGEAPWPG